jgi:hypothetical protein
MGGATTACEAERPKWKLNGKARMARNLLGGRTAHLEKNG